VFFTNETILLKLTTVELSVPSCHMYCSVDVQVAPLRYFVSDDVIRACFDGIQSGSSFFCSLSCLTMNKRNDNKSSCGLFSVIQQVFEILFLHLSVVLLVPMFYGCPYA